MHATSLANRKPMLPRPVGGYRPSLSSTPLWERVRMRARELFATSRTSHEMALVFEALQDANLRIEALEERLDG